MKKKIICIKCVAAKQFHSSVPFPKETSHLICTAYQMTGFYLKHYAEVKWAHIKKAY